MAIRKKEIEEEHFKTIFLCVTNIQHDNWPETYFIDLNVQYLNIKYKFNNIGD